MIDIKVLRSVASVKDEIAYRRNRENLTGLRAKVYVNHQGKEGLLCGDYGRLKLGSLAAIEAKCKTDFLKDPTLQTTLTRMDIQQNMDTFKGFVGELLDSRNREDKYKFSMEDICNILNTQLRSYSLADATNEQVHNVIKVLNNFSPTSVIKYRMKDKVNEADTFSSVSAFMYKTMLPEAYLTSLYVDAIERFVLEEQISPVLQPVHTSFKEGELENLFISLERSVKDELSVAHLQERRTLSRLLNTYSEPIDVLDYDISWLLDEELYELDEYWDRLEFQEDEGIEKLIFVDLTGVLQSMLTVTGFLKLYKRLHKKYSDCLYVVDRDGMWLDLLNRKPNVRLFVMKDEVLDKSEPSYTKMNGKSIVYWRSGYRLLDELNRRDKEAVKGYATKRSFNAVLRPQTHKGFRGQPFQYKVVKQKIGEYVDERDEFEHEQT